MEKQDRTKLKKVSLVGGGSYQVGEKIGNDNKVITSIDILGVTDYPSLSPVIRVAKEDDTAIVIPYHSVLLWEELYE